MEDYHKANELLLDGDLDGCLELYDSACKDLTRFCLAFSNRGEALLRKKLYSRCIESCNRAIEYDPKHEPSYLRKAHACFELEEYESALQALNEGLPLVSKSKDSTQYSRLIRKCEAELAADDVSSTPPSATPSSAAVATPSPIATPTPASLPEIRYQYYQNDNTLTISVLIKDLPADDLKVDLKELSLFVSVKRPSPNGDGKKLESIVISEYLYDTVDLDKSKINHKKTKVEIILHKKAPSQWPSIKGNGKAATSSESELGVTVEPAATTPAVAAASAVSPVPRPYASKKDWNKVGMDIEKELEADKPEGEEALNKLFKDIYGKADEDTRRAMNKSFQTSGGTVLSTNWGEVAKKDYENEKQAPKGMQWQSWEGEKLKQIED